MHGRATKFRGTKVVEECEKVEGKYHGRYIGYFNPFHRIEAEWRNGRVHGERWMRGQAIVKQRINREGGL